MLKPWKQPPSHEALFIERYERLLSMARRLPDVSLEQAEDLVHDAFIQFTVCQPSLDQIQNLDAYLQRMVRNLRISEIRRRPPVQTLPLETLDYETAELTLQAKRNEQASAAVRDELSAICHYATLRKETSRAGSALILRFFHGYYIHEVAQILRTQKQPVYDLLRIARREARLFRDNSERLRFIGRKPDDPKPFPGAPDADDLVERLRGTIFSSCRTPCVPVKQLRDIYRSEQSESIDTPLAAHVASCQDCLKVVNRLLRMPSLRDRFPTDTPGQDPNATEDKDRTRKAGNRSSNRNWLSECRGRADEIYRHDPQELHVSVNGFILVRQTVNGGASEQTMSINLAEPIAFIEIFCEHGLRLAFFNVDSPTEVIEQMWQVNLSGGRTLTLSLNCSQPWPQLHVRYHSPATAMARDESTSAPLPDETSAFRRSALPESEQTSIMRWLWRLGASKLAVRPFALPLIFATTFVLALLYWTREPLATASNLLQRAATIEAGSKPQPHQATHRVIHLEERRTSDDRVLARRRLDVWQRSGQARQITHIQRVYNEDGRLIAGEWRQGDGTSTIKRKIESRNSDDTASTIADLRPDQIPRLPHNTGEAALFELSARTFSALTDATNGHTTLTIEERPDAYVIAYRHPPADLQSTDPLLTRASLTLERPYLHAVEQSLVVKQGSEEREWRFTEAVYDAHAVGEINDHVFEPEAELSGAKEERDADANRHREAEAAAGSPSISSSSLAALEVEALSLLAQSGGSIGEQINVSRSAGKQLRLDGLVETAARKAELLRALQPFRNQPAIVIEIKTVAEALSQQQPDRQFSSPVREFVAGDDMVPAASEIAGYLAQNGNSSNEAVRQFARHILAHLNEITLQDAELRRLARRFSADELRSFDDQVRAKWLTLVGDRAEPLEKAIRAMREELRAVFLTGGGENPSGSESDLRDETSLVHAITQLHDLCLASDQVFRPAFVLSAQNSYTPAALKEPQVWQSLKNAEVLAGAIAARSRRR